MIDPEVISAKNDVEVARAKLLHSVKFALGETKRRLAPDLIAEMAWQETKRASGKVADAAMDFGKRKPVLVGGLAAAFGMFLARKPLGKLAVAGYEKMSGEDEVPADGSHEAQERAPDAAPSVEQFRQTNKAVERKAAAPQDKETEKTS